MKGNSFRRDSLLLLDNTTPELYNSWTVQLLSNADLLVSRYFLFPEAVFLKVSQASYMSTFSCTFSASFFNFLARHKSEFWHFWHTWPTSSAGAHQALMQKLEAETTRLFSTVLPSRAHVPDHITHWPFLPPLDACPPSASMVGNFNVGNRGRLFTSPGITQALYFLLVPACTYIMGR